MKNAMEKILKEHAAATRPDFDPRLHQRIVSGVGSRAVQRRARAATPFRAPWLVLSLAACAALAITLYVATRETPAPNPKPLEIVAADLPTPRSILEMNIEPAGKNVADALSPALGEPLASLDGLPAFFQAQLKLLPE